jgi:hypothetical protein
MHRSHALVDPPSLDCTSSVLFNPAVTPSKICASNRQSAKNFPNPPIKAALRLQPLREPQPSQISSPLFPQPSSNSWRADPEMAPKRSNEKDGKKKKSQPPSGEWTHSRCSNNNLKKLVSEGLLQEKSLVNWRPSFCEPFPMKNVDEIVTFYHFAERGLALPSCSFFRGLLYFYGLELHHLNLNSICHIAIFIHLCEAFLGIEPHWDLFRFLFRVKPQPTAKNLSVVGGTGIQLRQQAGDRYLSYKFSSNIPGWKNHWFYIENHAPQLPEKSSKPLVVRPEWNTEVSRVDLDQVDESLAIIAAHKEIGVTEASVMCGRTNSNYTGSSTRVHFCGLQRASNGIIPWSVG